jgi:methyl-accepting chemotaxis protein
MAGGTAVVLGLFGYFIGSASQQIHERAARLDDLNRTVAHQKEEFERRFQDLNSSIKNFHAINTHIQKTIDPREVMRLAADGLHEILGYDRVNILMVTPKGDQLEFMASRGSGKDNVAGLKIPLDERAGALFLTVRDKRLFLVDDITKFPDEFHLRPPVDQIVQLRSKTFILCPIIVRDEVVGLFGVDNKLKRKALDDTDVDTVKLFADQVSSTLTKINLLEAVETLTGELEKTFVQLLQYRGEHARCDESLHQATSATGESIGDIVQAADVVRHSVDTTRSSASQISVSIEQVSQNLNQLNEFMEKSIASMNEIATTINSVEESSASSLTMSETVRSQASEGSAGVARTVEDLMSISGSVDETVGAIGRLAEKSEEIGTITGVITEITQKTNLLALNAAIIAAQAGEHGRSFAVVAEEVRSLSQEAANSTGAITGIVQEIQTFTRDTVDSIEATRSLVQQGITQGRQMEGSLRQILESSDQAMTMAHEIRKATREVARAVESVSRSIEDLGEMSGQVTVASREQAQGTRSIVQSIEEIMNMADEMVESTERQRRSTQDIERAANLVTDMVRQIFSAMEERQAGSREVVESLQRLKEGSAGRVSD